jgi:hypothetical protein
MSKDPCEMDWRRYVRSHLPTLDMRAEREVEIVDELALQLEAAYGEAVAEGCPPDEAMRRVASEIPDWHALGRHLEQIEASTTPRLRHDLTASGAGASDIMSGFALDLRHAARGLLHSPGYALVAIVTLALGLGLGAAAFSLVDGVLVRPCHTRRPTGWRW